uniref:EF-hand domain-containing protein n=1 Tax=Meloidogyne incognita TaxID=6306 RepID=A0A914L461_MELIC
MAYIRLLFIPFLFLSIYSFPALSDKEEVPLNTVKRTRTSFDAKHMGEGKHDIEMDHKAVLGPDTDEYNDLPPEESKKRLRVLALKMDVDKDGFISSEELNEWVHNSLVNVDLEETKERAEDEAKKVLSDSDDLKLLEEDRRYFAAADLNGDLKLNFEEFVAFQNPEHAEHMHDILIQNTLNEKDANKNGKIDLAEFLGDLANEQPKSEWFLSEQSRFQDEYDKNKDGVLDGEEMRAWLVPDLKQTAKQEADHLIESADENKDGKLSIDEVVNAYKIFVGSEVTNYGEHLLSVSHEEL